MNNCASNADCLQGPNGCYSDRCLQSITNRATTGNKEYEPGCDFNNTKNNLGCATAKDCRNLWCSGGR